ncbi:VOC family protein [Streptomyces sp. NPDC050842]|uniref:VOC family protein n=1 Tax=Streptomyces sp. NPDC050842 TaxID=3365636 RepID=UPI0037A4A6D5
MKINATTVSLTVPDVTASAEFFTGHLGFTKTAAADGFASLSRQDGACDLVLLQRGTEVLPADQRDQRAAGLILAFTLTGIEAAERKLRDQGVEITMPLREEPWGERLFQITDPNGIVVQFVEWTTPAHA